MQKIEEKINILDTEIAHASTASVSLREKIERYDNLKKVVEEINENLDLDYVAENLTNFAFTFIASSKGTCFLYLINSQNQKLNLFKTKKEDAKLVIKAKEGDIFDFWVLRHGMPLMIDDAKNDFRFDSEKLKPENVHSISSLISSPFISEHKFLGSLRLDNPKPNFFSQDDLRFLAAICDLGAVALEDSTLFRETQNLAIHDGLTSVYTKGHFLERLKEECSRGMVKKGDFSLFMLDIDYFKNYNDQFGHTAGDMVLKKITRNISDFLKNHHAVVGRFGGEEFCVLLPGIEKKNAFDLANDLRRNIEKEEVVLRRQQTHITVSIGVASFPVDATLENELIKKADKAMYMAKEKGRNQVCCI